MLQGTGQYYENATYALVKVDELGNIHVVYLCDHDKKILKP